MNVHKVTLIILDFDDIGEEEIKIVLENQRYPNHCISPDVLDIETVDIGEWDDDHPLNITSTFESEAKRIFNYKS